MPRVCHFTGKSTRTGNKYRLRGRPKYLGGVGTKITACTKRKFKPNIQRVRALVDGQATRVKVCTRCIKSGKIVKQIDAADADQIISFETTAKHIYVIERKDVPLEKVPVVEL